ncbi:3-oxoacyl-[acyl-carrier-protein] reductase FabG [Rubripirellula tenax]|uniref:3-oxoacyl-[acyl-carrier-protein] reductase FabG n=1 Tax=Rubripirellula tenax TaxID=2528015 RepID=A0A5C6EBM2_9BACT|nr:3-ketoacyl-ACP reductase [Rubripirellula tenax]TWU46120.1 3-oxoacyl-[acyl-carrier-protein] reductase FabG [Rubripirellula tenax]
MNKKVALVTGGGRGIGFGICEKLAADGFNLVLSGRSDASKVADAVEKLEGLGAEVLYCAGDVASAEDRAAMLAEVKERFGRLDVLVNNAGVAPRVRADILEATEDSFEWIMRINLQGPYFLSQACANWMIQQKRADDSFTGCIINVGSISATVVSPNRGDYCISKAGLGMMNSLFAARLGEFAIPVYEIRPGLIKTDMTAGVTEKYDNLIYNTERLVEKRWGMPEDIGKLAAAMARGDMPYASGQVIYVDGGLTMNRL